MRASVVASALTIITGQVLCGAALMLDVDLDSGYINRETGKLNSAIWLLDYGVTLILAGTVILLFLEKRLFWHAPVEKTGFMPLLATSILLTLLAFILDHVVEFMRMLIAIAHLEIFPGFWFLLLLFYPVSFWGGLHLLFLPGVYVGRGELLAAFGPSCNPWLLLMGLLSCILLLWHLVHGRPFDFLSSLAWLYFYLSLAASRVAGKERVLQQTSVDGAPV
jgi:hypothetical protein